MIAQAARKKGLEVAVAAHEGATDPHLVNHADQVVWVKIGQLGRILDFFKTHGVGDAVMAGGLVKADLFSNLAPDLRAMSLMARLPNLNDDTVLRGMAEEFESEGIIVRPATYFTPELLIDPGIYTQRPPSSEEYADIRLGWQVAKALGAMDVGQCVVVRNRTVLAVEAIEGTNETIRRGGRLGREKSVVVKVCKPAQDFRFDLPSIGPETVAVMQEVQATTLAIEARRTIIFDQGQTMAAADLAGIAVVALTDA